MKPLLSLLVLVAACSKDNPYYCEQNPDHNCSIDAGMTGSGDSSTACETAEDCGGGTPACNDSTGLCVACTATDIGACTGTKPVCSTSNSCRGCTMNAECASGACMPDGSCADAASLLYASPTGGATTCAAADKCSLEAAITAADATKKIIVLDAGSYTTTTSISTNKVFTLLGRDATIIKGGASAGPVLGLTSGANVTVLYAKLKNGDDDTVGHGIACQSATLVARFVTISNNASNGINTTGCDVTIDRSTITANPAGAISITGSNQPFTITNNFIYLNGSSSLAFVGGVKIAVSSPTSSRFEFNTIIDNTAINGSGNTGGAACSVALSAPNNIVAHNILGTSNTATDANTTGNCSFLTSLVQNEIADIQFTNAATPPYNLKIGQTSTAKDMATTASTVTVDFEGDERPQNGQKDIGADEYK